MKAWRIELRYSVVLLAMPVLLLVGVIAAWRALWPGVEVWRNASQSIVASVQLLGPASAAIAAWSAGRDRRRGTAYLDELSARPSGTAVLLQLAAALTWTSIAYAVVAAAVLVRTIPGAHWGGPMIVWIISGYLGLLVHVVAGFLIGRSLPYRFVPPLLAFAFYAIEVVLTNGGGAWAFLSPVTLQEQDSLFDTNQTLLVGQALWYLGTISVLLLGWWAAAAQRRRLVTTTTLAPAMALAVLGAVLVGNQHGHFLVGPTQFTYACQGTAPQVCVQPAFQGGLATLDKAIEPVASRLAGSPWAIHRVEQRDRGIGSTPGPGSVSIFIDDFGPGWAQKDVEEMLSIVVYGPNAYNPCWLDMAKANDPADPAQYNDLVTAWLADDSTLFQAGNDDGRRALSWFLAQPLDQQKAWLRAHAAKIRSCGLTSKDFS